MNNILLIYYLLFSETVLATNIVFNAIAMVIVMVTIVILLSFKIITLSSERQGSLTRKNN